MAANLTLPDRIIDGNAQVQDPGSKVLSHRLRGFGQFEHTPEALQRALASAVRSVEIDTRVSRDGEIFVFHDRVAETIVHPRTVFAETPASEIAKARFSNGEPLMTLRRLIEIFVAQSRPDQRLCVDIKDAGFEAQHLALIRDHGLEARVAFVSWIPQVLLRLAELETQAPLVFSHVNLLRWGPLGSCAISLTSRMLRPFGSHCLVGINRVSEPLGMLSRGYQHLTIAGQISGSLLHCLRASGGGICVDKAQNCDALRRFCRTQGLQLWLFSVRTPDGYLRLAAHDEVQLVFCDDAALVLSELSQHRSRDS
jgi:glycerophosphoryl diester phosphodiesterase